MAFETQQLETLSAKPLVLVTDDNPQARLLLRRILEREGFRVEEANDGNLAIEKALAEPPDLILMDIQMQGIDGFETVRRLRENPHSAHIPIIVVTAAAREPADVARGLGLGADDYLLKPFNSSELLARANSKIRARRLEDKLQQRTEELETLVQLGMEMNQGLALNAIADHLLAAVLKTLPTSTAILALFDEESHPDLIRSNALNGANAELLAPNTLPGAVLSQGEAILVRDIETSINPCCIFLESDCRSGIGVPFKHNGRVLGVMALGSPKPNGFSASSLRVLRSIAEQAALAIANARMFSQLQAYAQNLETMVEARTADLKTAQTQLVRADKLAALGTMAAGIAHEVNNPLQPILTNLEMTLEDIDDGRPVDRELIEFSVRDVQRIERLVRRLLDFARTAPSELTSVNINDIVRDVLTLAGKQLEHERIKVETRLTAVRKIRANADQVRQVILNLVINAKDAMPNGGKLIIDTAEEASFAVVVVADTGIGISADRLSQIFDPFHTTKSDGTGLGLSVSHSIIEGHGGKVEVTSKLNKGTRFTVYLPLESGR